MINKNPIRYLSSVIGWAALFLILTELFIRLFFFSSLELEKYTVEIWGTEGYGISLYLPSGEVATPYDDGKKIVVMGDSFTVARQVSHYQKYVAVAEELLRQRGLRLDLRNLSLGNTSMPYRISAAPKILKKYQPELVVLQTSYTDFMVEGFDPASSVYFQFDEAGNISVEKHSTKDQEVENSFWGKSFLKQFSTWRYLETVQTNRTEAAGTVSAQPFDNPGLKMDKDELLIKETDLLLSTYQNIPLIFIVLPTRFDYSGGAARIIPTPNEQWLVEHLSAHPGWSVIYPVEEFNALLAQGYSPYGFGNSKPFSGHMNADGNRVLGTILAGTIEKILK